MIKRIYIHNYWCLENFAIDFADRSSVLILGKNGTGKSAILRALGVLQSIARGPGRIKESLSLEDFSQYRTNIPIRIEVNVELDAKIYEYSIAFEWSEGFREASIKDEKLTFDGTVIYSREEAQVNLVATSTNFLVDWHFAALPIVQIRSDANPIKKLRNWMAGLVLIDPVPVLMTGDSSEETLCPNKYVSNFGDWFTGVIGEYPASYVVIENFIKEFIPDFLDFQNKPTAETAKKIIVRFGLDGKILSLDLSRLSDGEKCFFVCSALLGLNQYCGSVFCFWDEPGNFLSISEVGHMMIALRKSFEKSGQLIVTSHNPEAIRKFSDENTLYLDRRSHLEPTTARWLSDLNYKGDLVEALIRGDLIYGE